MNPSYIDLLETGFDPMDYDFMNLHNNSSSDLTWEDGRMGGNNSDDNTGPEQKIGVGEKCVICEGKASGFNYRVVSCNACKAFFRRCVLSGKRYECRFEGIDRLKQSMESARILSICQHCRLAKCRDVGMRDDYVHNLRFHRIERNSNKLTKNPTVTSFRSALDPGQLNLLELCVNFWSNYRKFPTLPRPKSPITPGKLRKMTPVDRLEMQIAKIPIPLVKPTNTGAILDRIKYISDTIKTNVEIVSQLLNHIPEIKTLSKTTLRYCTLFGSWEMSLVRGANNGIYEEVPDTTLPVQTTKALSIGGQEMNTQQLRDAGLSGGLIDGMMDICWGEQLRNHQPDEIEWSLLGALCVFNIDRGLGLFNPTPAERKQIETIQQTILMILRMKLAHDRKPMRLLAAYVSFIAKVHSYANQSIPEWGKYLYFQPKIVLQD